jgi:hypothetical protein
MKVNVNIKHDNMTINETFSGANAEAIVTAIKARVVKELPFALRLLAGGMSPLMFAQETVKRYNETMKTNVRRPNSCEDFLQLAQEEGLATIIEP